MNVNSLGYITIGYDLYSKKIDGQIKALVNDDIDVYLFCYNNDEKCYQCIVFTSKGSKTIHTKSGAWSKKKYVDYVYTVLQTLTVDCIYIRRPGISILRYGKVLRQIKSRNVKLIFEIPTYPLDITKGFSKAIAQILELSYLKRKVFPASTVIPVFLRNTGVKMEPNMIRSTNCVDYEKFKHIAFNKREKRDHFSMLGIAFTQYWHGYDRLIKSMQVSNNQKITFTLFGNFTEETYRLINYCKENNIKNVFFIEEKDISSTDDFYSGFDIGVGCLGLHRREKKQVDSILDTSIKNKEYCAMGLPFIHAAKDEAFPDDFKYHKRVPDDESIIDLDEIISWVESLEMNTEKQEEMWKYAKEKLGFNSYINKILESL